jgi:hypothetical protein
MPNAVMNDPIRSAGTVFPDLWAVHLMRQSRLACLAGLLLMAVLLIVAVGALVRIVWGRQAHTA